MVSIENQLQITSGKSTIDGPIWMIPRISTADVIRLAAGTPATTRPMPASSACSTEMPITPRDYPAPASPSRSFTHVASSSQITASTIGPRNSPVMP